MRVRARASSQRLARGKRLFERERPHVEVDERHAASDEIARRPAHRRARRSCTIVVVGSARYDTRVSPAAALISATAPSATISPASIRTMRRRERVGFFEVVRREQDRATVVRVRTDRFPDGLARAAIETGRRLVEHDEFRGAGECERDGDPTTLAAGEAAELASGNLLELEALVASARAGSGCGKWRRTRSTSSCTRNVSGNAVSCGVTPTNRRADGLRGSSPKSRACPASGARRPSSTAIAVDLPAPFGPSRASTSPSRTSRLTASRAATAPKRFVTSLELSDVHGGRSASAPTSTLYNQWAATLAPSDPVPR